MDLASSSRPTPNEPPTCSLKRKNSISSSSLDHPIHLQNQNQNQNQNQITPFNLLSTNLDSSHHHSHKKLKSSLSSLSNGILQLDLNKPALLLNQKPIELCEVSNSVKKALVAVTEELEASTSQLIDLSSHQLLLVGCLVHESDKPLQELVPYVHSKLLPQTKLEAHGQLQKAFDPLPLATLETSIQLAAQRVNYAPTHSDIPWLPAALPKGFQIWRWEAKDRSAVVPSELHEVYQKRFDERQLINSQACALLAALELTDRETLLKKLSPTKRKPKATGPVPTSSNPIPPPSGSQDGHPCSQPSPATKPKKTRTTSDQSTDGPPTEKELLRIQKEQRRREKEEAKQAELTQKKKMGNLLSGWIQKAGPSGAAKPKVAVATPDALELTGSAQNGVLKTVERADKSEFEKMFRPFNLKANTELAPVNRFRGGTKLAQNLADDKSGAQEADGLAPKKSLDEFLRSVPADLLPPRASQSSRRLLTVREIVQGIAESEMGGQIEGTKKWRRLLQNRVVVPVKLLRFHEDVRPGYVGTWGKSSRLVSGRNPFGKETCLLDYEYDSEADWMEEDGEGEDLGQSDGAQEEGGSSEAGGESDDDGWLVGDEEEVEVDDDVAGHEACSRALDGADAGTTTTKTKVCGPTRRKVVAPLVPVVKGPMWEDTLGEVSLGLLERFRIEFIKHACVGVDPFTYVGDSGGSKGVMRAMDSGHSTTPGSNGATTEGIVQQVATGFPSDLVPKLISIVNGSKKSKPVLIEELRESLSLEGNHHQLKVTKKSIEKMVNLVAGKFGGVWRVNGCSDSSSSSSSIGGGGGGGGVSGSGSGKSLGGGSGGEKCMNKNGDGNGD